MSAAAAVMNSSAIDEGILDEDYSLSSTSDAAMIIDESVLDDSFDHDHGTEKCHSAEESPNAELAIVTTSSTPTSPSPTTVNSKEADIESDQQCSKTGTGNEEICIVEPTAEKLEGAKCAADNNNTNVLETETIVCDNDEFDNSMISVVSGLLDTTVERERQDRELDEEVNEDHVAEVQTETEHNDQPVEMKEEAHVNDEQVLFEEQVDIASDEHILFEEQAVTSSSVVSAGTSLPVQNEKSKNESVSQPRAKRKSKRMRGLTSTELQRFVHMRLDFFCTNRKCLDERRLLRSIVARREEEFKKRIAQFEDYKKAIVAEVNSLKHNLARQKAESGVLRATVDNLKQKNKELMMQRNVAPPPPPPKYKNKDCGAGPSSSSTTIRATPSATRVVPPAALSRQPNGAHPHPQPQPHQGYSRYDSSVAVASSNNVIRATTTPQVPIAARSQQQHIRGSVQPQCASPHVAGVTATVQQIIQRNVTKHNGNGNENFPSPAKRVRTENQNGSTRVALPLSLGMADAVTDVTRIAVDVPMVDINAQVLVRTHPISLRSSFSKLPVELIEPNMSPKFSFTTSPEDFFLMYKMHCEVTFNKDVPSDSVLAIFYYVKFAVDTRKMNGWQVACLSRTSGNGKIKAMFNFTADYKFTQNDGLYGRAILDTPRGAYWSKVAYCSFKDMYDQKRAALAQKNKSRVSTASSVSSDEVVIRETVANVEGS